MNRQQDTFTAANGVKIFSQSWLPDRSPKAVLLVAHGLAEHSERYHLLAKFMVDNDIAVYSLDHQGHGRSEGRRGHIKCFEHYVQPLYQLQLNVEHKHPQLPVFVLGHSMGGLIAAVYAQRYQQRLQGCLLSGPAFEAAEEIGAGALWQLKILSRLLPGLGALQLDATAVCSDPEVVSDYQADPLIYHGKVSARLVCELLGQAEQALEQAPSMNLPLLVMHGEGDTMTLPSGSKAYVERAGSNDKTLHIYPNMLHEVFHEPGKEKIFQQLVDWIQGHMVPDAERL